MVFMMGFRLKKLKIPYKSIGFGGEGVILLLQAALREGQQLQAGLRTPIPA